MNSISIGISSIGIEATTDVLIVCLYLLYLLLFPPRSTSNFYQYFKEKIFFTSTSIGKCRKCLERNLVYFLLAEFHPKKAMSQPLCFDIEYWRSYRPFLSKKLQWNKIQSSFIVLLLKLYNLLKITPLAGVSTTESYGYGVYSYAHFYQLNVEDFVVISTMVIFFFFLSLP